MADEVNSTDKKASQEYDLEMAMMALAIVLAFIGLYFYVRFTPKEDIPADYFFKVREPKVRQRREAQAKAKKALLQQKQDQEA